MKTFYITTTVFYYIVIHHLFIHQPPLTNANKELQLLANTLTFISAYNHITVGYKQFNKC